MLPYSEWLDQAELLPEGSKRRVNHCCGPGRTMLVANEYRGYSAHCFRCNDGGFKAHGLRTLDQLAAAKEARRYANEQNCTGNLKLPADFTQDIPIEGRMWYYRAGCTDGIARLYGFGWSAAQQRVVIPVRTGPGRDLAFVQSRAVRPGQQPKYLNIHASNRGGVAFLSDPRTIGYYSNGSPEIQRAGDPKHPTQAPEDQGVPSSRIVCCEDILSAIRVGMSTPACAILGTRLDEGLARQLCKYQRVTFWLDGDSAGIKGRLHGLRTLKLLHPGQVDYIKSPSDPKSYCQEEIAEWLTP